MKKLTKKNIASGKRILKALQGMIYHKKYGIFLKTYIKNLFMHLEQMRKLDIVSYSDKFATIEKLIAIQKCVFDGRRFIQCHAKLDNLSKKIGIGKIQTVMFEQTISPHDMKMWEWINEHVTIVSYTFESRKDDQTEIRFEKSMKRFSSLFLQLHSVFITIPINNTMLCCTGYLPYSFSPTLQFVFPKKHRELEKYIKMCPYPLFAQEFMEQICPNVFCYSSVSELQKLISDQNLLLKDIQMKTISELVKLFLTTSTVRKRDILITLLLNTNDDDDDTEHLAFLLYDMISQKSFLLSSSKENTNVIYESLHWTFQQKLSSQISISKNVLEKSDAMTDMTDVISYEKQIMLLHVSESVKGKALAKLKEIKNGKGDSSTKAVQYLDGLLNIPFGLYRSEFVHELSSFRKRLHESLTSFNNNSKENDTDETWQKSMKELFKNNETYCSTSHSMGLFFEKTSCIYNNELVTYIQKKLKGLPLSELKQYAENYDIKLTNQRKKDSIIIDLFPVYNEIISKRSDFYHNEDIALLKSCEKLGDDWRRYSEKKCEYMKDVGAILDSAVYGLDDAKNQIKSVIGQWINGEEKGYVFGFEGPMGTGKTTLAKKGIAECLKNSRGQSRPFTLLALGGSTNGSTLEGHNFTYVGSTWGKIVDCLMEAKCMNPIIYIDELDKISNTEHGKEIIGILIHLTDPSQNEEFSDRYFRGIPIDLSKCLIIFSYNDASKVDKILLDRIHRVHTKALSKFEKINITLDFVLPELTKLVGFGKEDIVFSKEVIIHIIDGYTSEAGVRKLKEKVLKILREINLRIITSQDVELPYCVSIADVDEIFDKDYKFVIKQINPEPIIGLINGLYASASSRGGITLIQSFKKFSEKNFGLEITGQQGDVMKESIRVSTTIAWHILTDKFKTTFLEENENFGIHLHCPETATPKDGPSAGAAITTSLISIYTNVPIINTCAMTGEIDLHGNVMRIGGLSAKLEGARCAGVKKVLIPESNRSDYDKIRKYDKGFVENDDFQIICVETIYDVLPHMFASNTDIVMNALKKKCEYFI